MDFESKCLKKSLEKRCLRVRKTKKPRQKEFLAIWKFLNEKKFSQLF